MQPSCPVFYVRILTQRFDRSATVSNERPAEPTPNPWIANALEVDEPGPTQKPGSGKSLLILTRDQQHRTHTPRGVVIGNRSRPPGLSAFSQDGSGWVAPALTMMTSTGSNAVCA